MIISFEGPTFFAPEDEDHFFSWIYSLSEYKKIIGTGTTLDLELASPVSADTVRQLLILFCRWRIGPSPLISLRSAETDHFVLWDAPLQVASSDT
ncbi:hypothetical protein GGR60_001741 [Xanthomonas arboricola]|uniref:hypothetical protein n=1 Tax=Xanthomonas euroxanthea TaxID=2259622 RepID=UPI00141B2698|nr:hypothetical protein [Xanthomonas euroxanthea]MBB3777470.1 hypothetical protein [Xanthomonas euroxanthea]NIK08982.1 hypothetical protein [Xanthomonas euroxanthea]NIK40800.1 hypothetical protein [Xanthomonas euroxanthea]NJC37206.1 hypothetical protein [Xanthomonas euroxanthea]